MSAIRFSIARLIRLSALLAFALLAIALPPGARAATVAVGNGPCTFTLDGQITGGEYDQLAAFKGDAMFWSETGFDMDPVLCLDSEGGSLTEGIKVARFVYDQGVQTRIGDGARCYSICAIIFMMGNKHAGPTSIEENRILHVRGDLAFHSPSISIDDGGQYSSDQIKRAYTLGIESILSLVELANSPRVFEAGAMMHPELIGNLLATPSTELFHLRTIEQALIWDIGLEGLDGPLPQLAVQRQMACETGLLRGFRQPSRIYDGHGGGSVKVMSDSIFDLAPLPDTDTDRILWDYDAADGQDTVYGFRYSALPMECRVRIDGDRVEVCGYDSNYRITVGDCEDDVFVTLPPYARYHPVSEIKAISTSGLQADALRSARCTLRDTSGAELRDAPCTQAVDLVDRPDRDNSLHRLYWPSGTPTRVEIAVHLVYEDGPDLYRVDGALAEPHGKDGTCLLIPGRGEILCVTGD